MDYFTEKTSSLRGISPHGGSFPILPTFQANDYGSYEIINGEISVHEFSGKFAEFRAKIVNFPSRSIFGYGYYF